MVIQPLQPTEGQRLPTDFWPHFYLSADRSERSPSNIRVHIWSKRQVILQLAKNQELPKFLKMLGWYGSILPRIESEIAMCEAVNFSVRYGGHAIKNERQSGHLDEIHCEKGYKIIYSTADETRRFIAILIRGLP